MKVTMVTQYHWTAESGWFPLSVSYKRQGEAEVHNHEMEHMDMLKRNKALRDLVGGEVANGYQPHQIFRNLQGYHRGPEAQQTLTAAGGEYMQRRDVVNAGLVHCKANPDPHCVGAKYQWAEQQLELIEWLESAGYLAANPTATRQRDHEMSPGIVWAHPDYIVVLRQRGHLTLMNSTHQTNWLGWFLYTLLVRDECGASMASLRPYSLPKKKTATFLPLGSDV